MQTIKSTLLMLVKGNFSKLFIVLVLVQIINFGFSILLPRFFSPEQFATFGVFTAIVFIIIEIVNLKLDVAVQLPKNNEAALQVLGSAIGVAFFISGLIFIVSIFLSIKYGYIYILLSFIILSYGIYQPIFYWLNRQEQVAVINIARIMVVLLSPIIALAIALFTTLNNGLIIGFVIAQCIATLFLLIRLKLFSNINISIDQIKTTLNEFRHFPKYGVLSSLLNSISKNMVVPILQFFFGGFYAGSYTMANRLLQAPIGSYTTAMGQVYFQKASQLNGIALHQFTKQVVIIGFILSLIPTMVLLFFAPNIFQMLFGNEWLLSGKITQYIILFFMMNVIVQPISFLLDIQQLLKKELWFNIAFLLFRVLALAIGIYFNQFMLSIQIFSIISCILYLILLIYILKITKQNN